MFQHIVYSLANRQGLFAYVRTCKTRLDATVKFMVVVNIAVQSCYFIIPWPHVLSCMNMSVDLSWWFKQRCSSLFVHQAMNSLFQQPWASLSTTMFKLASSTMFKLASSTMFKPVNRQKLAVRFYACVQPQTTYQHLLSSFKRELFDSSVSVLIAMFATN